ncbi:beta-ketoacyl synthase N-terminal-like domain-containing protein [Zoogloea sp.]|uniref:beta-ketoacyl synthase N-terminal-like domain-containing protein n=1 Tax=Zoogloea sp. TaxID=49181 RepID=UPI0025FF6EE2|nr:beta-ketoacyl synthase N-terminal-like domain-containing protein [Zoogloea sp.]MCK6392132.1 hypothetical protein [Zoogloea sp.]
MSVAGSYLQGRGLACALGLDLPRALARLAAGGVRPAMFESAPDAFFPAFTIPDADPDWHARGRRLVRAAVAECGPVDRSAPLFLASSSLNVGALEQGSPFLPDCQRFAEDVAGWLDWRGPVFWVSTACTSSIVALLSAHRLIGAGEADSALVLGLELTNRFSSAGFGALQLLDPQAPRPLAADRAGLVLGEAVAAVCLGRKTARWRLRGGANRVDGSNPAGASRHTVERMVHAALADSGIGAAEVDLIKLQAAGSPHNDAEEIAGLKAVFPCLPALGTLKASIGHTLGAAGAAELALLTACIDAGIWPEPPGCAPDPDLAVALAPRRPPRLRFILAQILGFGGGHAALVLEDCQESLS